ncbi:DNA-binding transcriptional regulator, LysR family [Limimaricola pyoseonensis]|uniref:DNA-binding transcriptional regulator, LysR family n=1 Tax=Limimaricola pyoseonensis TaxID=521013 RepID=A0A1G7CRE8_9RHOB|nr:DNA-binding transcriptional regulator, LysR family [Limimaricola pyoseonensis]
MDTETVRTFVEIVAQGSFADAASRLHVAQTTVSARIKALEERVGQPLLYRTRGGVKPTPAGQQLLRLAPRFIQTGEQITRLTSVPEGHRDIIVVATEARLPFGYTAAWMSHLRQSDPELALRVVLDSSDRVAEGLALGEIDLALMHVPPHRPGIRYELFIEEKLVMLTTDPEVTSVDDPRFIHIDWGEQFEQDFKHCFGERTSRSIEINSGPLAMHYALSYGGAGYGRLRTVQPYLDRGEVAIVPDMPIFSYPLYVVHAENADPKLIDLAQRALRASLED